MKSRILLVDDNEEYLDSIKDVLEIEGYDVVTATDGESAVEMVESEEFQVIIMDIKMPGMNGVESFIEMKKNNPGVNVIMASAYSVEGLIKQAVNEGVRAVLSKPLNISNLFKIIDNITSQKSCGMVLVADDDRALSENLKEILIKEGYKTVLAHDGQEAVDKHKDNMFDIALIDMNLPLLNGLEVYRRMKQIHPEIIAIIISGYAEEMAELIDQALDEKARMFLTKPINIENLITILKDIQA